MVVTVVQAFRHLLQGQQLVVLVAVAVAVLLLLDQVLTVVQMAQTMAQHPQRLQSTKAAAVVVAVAVAVELLAVLAEADS
jgi:hypothetical protein